MTSSIKILSLLFIFSLFFFLFNTKKESSFQQIAVIVNPFNTSKLNQYEVSNIYLGIRSFYSNGLKPIAVGLKPNTDNYQKFSKYVLRKTKQDIEYHWIKYYFSGQGKPPLVLKDDFEIVNFVSKEPKAIGYVSINNITPDVRVIFTF